MPSSTTESRLAIVMTAGKEFPSNAVLAEAIKGRVPAIPSEILADPSGTLVFLHEDYMFVVGKVDAPCPISKDNPCVQFAWYRPDAWETVSKHKARKYLSASDASARANCENAKSDGREVSRCCPTSSLVASIWIRSSTSQKIMLLI